VAAAITIFGAIIAALTLRRVDHPQTEPVAAELA